MKIPVSEMGCRGILLNVPFPVILVHQEYENKAGSTGILYVA